MHVNHFKGAEEHKQWCDYRRIFLASRFALVYRAGSANPPVLQATLIQGLSQDVTEYIQERGFLHKVIQYSPLVLILKVKIQVVQVVQLGVRGVE